MTASFSASIVAQSAQAQTDDGTIEALFGADDSPTTRKDLSGQITLSPTIAYDRAISRILIQCSQIGMEQFEQKRRDPQFNGAIRSLPSYSDRLDRYTQIATFNVRLDATTTLLRNLSPIGNRITQRIVKPTQAFIGFALTTSEHNLIVFRGTSNPKEWIANFQATQSDYLQAGTKRGRVHTGFLRLYEQLSEQVRQVANQLNPALPCFVVGHSLGGALATLATADLAQNSKLKNQLRLYSYAAPRVGDRAFVQYLNTIAPNNYRIINLADIVPMVPPSNLRNQEYHHAGQEWVFLDYAGGEMGTSHAVSLYRGQLVSRLKQISFQAFQRTAAERPTSFIF
ncbi:lipase [Leptolyngbya sp. NIES-2104]|nr:lipase [Leptolyngbya sp. NIES-2104]